MREVISRYMKKILSGLRRAVDDYTMIDDGDLIAVGLSGGKDSMTLIRALAELRKFYPRKFDVIGINIDMGFGSHTPSDLADFCHDAGVSYRTVRTDIAKIVFDIRQEANPCSLCSRMRRGALYSEAEAVGARKLALGHHADDIIETFMMNMLFGSRLSTFSPVTRLVGRDLTLIRPMIYIKECDIISYAKKTALPVIKSPCPEDHATERERMKATLSVLESDYPHARERIFRAICERGLDGYKIPSKSERHTY